MLWLLFLQCRSLSVFVSRKQLLTEVSLVHRRSNDRNVLRDLGPVCAFVFCLFGYKHVERNFKLRKLFDNLSCCLQLQQIQEEWLIAFETILLWFWLEQSNRLARMNSTLSMPRAICYFLTLLRDQQFQKMSYSFKWNHSRPIDCLFYLRRVC